MCIKKTYFLFVCKPSLWESKRIFNTSRRYLLLCWPSRYNKQANKSHAERKMLFALNQKSFFVNFYKKVIFTASFFKTMKNWQNDTRRKIHFIFSEDFLLIKYLQLRELSSAFYVLFTLLFFFILFCTIQTNLFLQVFR